MPNKKKKTQKLNSRKTLDPRIVGVIICALAIAAIVGILSSKENNKQPSQQKSNAGAFWTKVESCSKSVAPAASDGETDTINGIVDGKCELVETMPNNGTMTCRFDESQRKRAADFYRYYEDIAFAEREQQDNGALNGFLNDGTCVINGYN